MKPCYRGHTLGRKKSNRQCIECHREDEAAARADDSSRVNAANAKWRQANPDAAKAACSNWRTKNYGRVLAFNAHRRALLRAQICKCCTREQIEEIYLACPPGHEVDHRIPLKLYGLHCQHNLQILTKAAHRLKTTEDLRNIAAVKNAGFALADAGR